MANEQTAVRKRVRTTVRKPRRYKVILYNDDFTTMDFVVMLLMDVFLKSTDEAQSIMMYIHTKGSAVAGIYSYDVAMSKTRKATQLARAQNFPLRIECKPE